MWDTLGRPEDMAGVRNLIGDLPTTVVYSHGDWDHVWGTSGLGVALEAILAHKTCHRRFDREIPEALSERRHTVPGQYDQVVLVPPTDTVQDGQRLELGGLAMEIRAFPGHTSDSIVGFCPEAGILLAGDAVENPLPFLNPGSRLDVWSEHLEVWRERLEVWRPESTPFTGSSSDREAQILRAGAGSGPDANPLVVPAHGPIGGPELLQENARYLQALQAGKDPKLPEDLSPFYQDTHANNMRMKVRP